MLIPSKKAPDLTVPLVGGGEWSLAKQRPENFTIIFFYRGLHCPLCHAQLEEVKRAADRFAELGIEIVAVSMDVEERARKSYDGWRLAPLKVGYGLAEPEARAWGLYISEARPDTDEPSRFSEPGVFVITPEQVVYGVVTQSMPFTRPATDGLIHALKYVVENNYPARGTLEI